MPGIRNVATVTVMLYRFEVHDDHNPEVRAVAVEAEDEDHARARVDAWMFARRTAQLTLIGQPKELDK